jgi:hypothetical protein
MSCPQYLNTLENWAVLDFLPKQKWTLDFGLHFIFDENDTRSSEETMWLSPIMLYKRWYCNGLLVLENSIVTIRTGVII